MSAPERTPLGVTGTLTLAVLAVSLVAGTLAVDHVRGREARLVSRAVGAAPEPAPADTTTDRFRKITDEFDRAAYVPVPLGKSESGVPWRTEAGQWWIDHDSPLAESLRSPIGAIATVDTGGVDAVVQLIVEQPGPGTGLVFRFVSVSDHWRIVARPELRSWVIERITAGHVRRMASARSDRMTATMRVGVLLQGRRVTMLFGDDEVATVVDESEHEPTARRAGLVVGPSDGARRSIAAFSSLAVRPAA